ncbi:MAG: DUF433 domain-containing protein [Leptolyngbyaceae cyanobacterium SM1_3_5]|nr:DUF433 domain-containing protein [Leptolyngbyaceae cyanobacterium SM1_3_5]
MQLEDYFDFLNADDIRIKGHRIGIDLVLEHYLDGYTTEETLAVYPDLSLEKIYATITYYLSDRSKLDAYLLRVRQQREQHYQEWAANPSPLIQRLRAIRTQQNREAVQIE